MTFTLKGHDTLGPRGIYTKDLIALFAMMLSSEYSLKAQFCTFQNLSLSKLKSDDKSVLAFFNSMKGICMAPSHSIFWQLGL